MAQMKYTGKLSRVFLKLLSMVTDQREILYRMKLWDEVMVWRTLHHKIPQLLFQ